MVLARCAPPCRPTRPTAASQLVISQMLGLVVARYLLALEPLASMPAEEVVALGRAQPPALPRRPAALRALTSAAAGQDA